jgi:hypothetical protein
MSQDQQHPDRHAIVVRTLRTKACMKQDVYHRTIALFGMLKEVVEEVATQLAAEVAPVDDRLKVDFTDKGPMACELRVAGDVIIFHMHTNVFRLDRSNALWRTSYLEEDELRGYFGLVNLYNFLSDSFRFNRERDLGYLVARLFLNKDDRFMLQGKKQLGLLYSDLPNNVMDRDVLKEIVYAVVQHVLDFDLLAPPYDQVDQVTVSEMNELNANLKISTGKRLGFRFMADMEHPE